MAETVSGPLHKTPLHQLHVDAGAKMVPFAGYDMPVQYPTGVLTEHNWTRSDAGLFDVSHMGQAFVVGPDWETTARALEALVPADILNLKPGQQRYSQLTAEDGGILDDLMITRSGYAGYEGWAYMVVNAACKDQDFAHIAARLPAGVSLKPDPTLALVALQGPKAAAVLDDLIPGIAATPFMTFIEAKLDGMFVHASRSGYTGEDGFELCIEAKNAAAIWQRLTADPRVKPIGLGARDSLRLEAGLCLYGHDIDTTTSPVEAGLTWSIQKRRRTEGGFPGAQRIQRELAEGPSRRRVGIVPDGRAPAREGTPIKAADGAAIGMVTSGGFGPTVNGPVAMGYVNSRFAEPGTPVLLEVRGKDLPAKVVTMPFAPHRYFRG
ncbi:glycine cleavage system aminomethyltransferase GcvT [Phreatobacter sp. AB_2022a]|uniref:glycine cleavage system aminomethyltransferase GcvT n=1 Tax=Phreatobacter sp. AB_2022a TaxID=3003134 RepID=UPI002286D7CA|nr:glycine cleavage system aminomethyltransferase GcvT [Phreatobacter sp. AB_2022a]MCZ0734617.1 glycine cleavage system aminomethyltransferase GcvT [Phreatobacter sp. AB_2022a]